MNNRHPDGCHFLLRRPLLLIEHEHVALVGFGIVLTISKSKRVRRSVYARISIVMSRHPIASISSRNRPRVSCDPPPASSMHSTFAGLFATTNASSALCWLSTSGVCAVRQMRQAAPMRWMDTPRGAAPELHAIATRWSGSSSRRRHQAGSRARHDSSVARS